MVKFYPFENISFSNLQITNFRNPKGRTGLVINLMCRVVFSQERESHYYHKYNFYLLGNALSLNTHCNALPYSAYFCDPLK